MKKITRRAALAAALSLTAGAAPAGTETPSAIFILIENGGVVTEREGAAVVVSHVLGEVAELRRRRATRDTQVHLVFSASPTEISWSGTPQQLFEGGAQVLELVKFKDTCSDLVLAWDKIALTAEITQPSDIRLIAVGPFINASFPCGSGQAVIQLPQVVPLTLKLSEVAKKASVLRLLNVHPDQDRVILDYLRTTEVMARVQRGALTFDLLGPARTRSALGRVLRGR